MPDQLPPPIAPRRPHEASFHGHTVSDPYYWLRERDDPAVLAYLNAENAYFQQVMQPTQTLQDQLYAELRGRIQEVDSSVPVRRGAYYYYTRVEAGQQYPIGCRKHGSMDAPEEVLLDQNQLAEGHSYFNIGAYSVSPDHQLLAYLVDTTGAETYTLHIKDLASGTTLADQIPNTYYGLEWANDSRTIFYTVLDDALRPYKVFRHTIGTDAAQDTLAYHEPDDSFFVHIEKTRDQAYLLIVLGSTSTSEVRFAPADQPQAAFAMIEPRSAGIEYQVTHHSGRFLIVTNDAAQNFKLVEAPIATPTKEHWRELIAHRADVLIDGIDAFQDFLAIYERENGLRQIRITRPDASNAQRVLFPEPVYTFTPGPNEEFASTTLRFSYTSLVTPNSVIDYDMREQRWELKKQAVIPSGYDPALYQSERVFATASDGAQVPISLVYRKGLARDGSNPLLLYGYGAYGFTIDPAFAAKRLSLLNRGFVFAIAHIRGGSDMGRAWYDQGKLLHKRNSFTDFIACAEQLIADGYTSSARLAIMGGSAGGLLMGAVVTMRPELFHAVIAQVPFVDVINTMSDPTLPLTVIEYEQWGNPADRAAYDYISSYSPYENTRATNYPHMLVTSGLNDPRVSYWEPAKWVARLRASKTDNNMLLLKTNMSTGHFGASGRYDELKDVAEEYAFLLTTIGEKTA